MMTQFNLDVQPFINKQFNGSTQGEFRSTSNTNKYLDVYDGKVIICIFLDDNQEKFIASFGNFNIDAIHRKTIKTIKQNVLTSISYGFIWDSFKESYQLRIECTDSSVILLESNYPFKIYNSYNDIHKNTPYYNMEYYKIDLD